MLLRSLVLQHFRNYNQQKFDFNDSLTIVVGKNTAGKTNLTESIYLLATGKSFKTNKDTDMIAFGQEVARVQGLIQETRAEVIVASSQASGGRFSKKFLINGVGKSRAAFDGLLPLVLFRPEELDIIIDGPSLRRNFLDEVLEQVDKEYRQAHILYEKALRQRNALLKLAKETGKRNAEQFVYWDNLLIENGSILSAKREMFLDYCNGTKHDIFPLHMVYDKSSISQARLLQYTDAEIGAGLTLVGPHRDDFIVEYTPDVRPDTSGVSLRDIRYFGSRGQSRLAVLQLKMFQIAYIQEILGVSPLCILDDIFSELDSTHIQLVLEKVQGSQIILTTTHKEFVPSHIQEKATMIELSK